MHIVCDERYHSRRCLSDNRALMIWYDTYMHRNSCENGHSIIVIRSMSSLHVLKRLLRCNQSLADVRCAEKNKVLRLSPTTFQ